MGVTPGGVNATRVASAVFAAFLLSSLLALGGVASEGRGAIASPKKGPLNPRWFGFNDQPESYNAERLSQAKQIGANVVRFPIDIEEVAKKGIERYDETIVAVRQSGMKALPVITALQPMPVSAVATVAAWTAYRYADALAAIQVWNEPNLFGAMSAKRYGAILNAAAEGVREVRPSVRILGGGLCPRCTGLAPYLRRAYRRVTNRKFVDVAIHLYPAFGENATPTGQTIRREVIEEVQTVREATGVKKVWITETGASAAQFGARQAWATRQIYKGAMRARATSLIYHRLFEPPPSVKHANEWEFRNKLWALDRAGRPTDLYYSLQTARSNGLRRAR